MRPADRKRMLAAANAISRPPAAGGSSRNDRDIIYSFINFEVVLPGMPKHALVAGASGLIGGHLVKSLLADGYRVRAVGRRPVSQWRQSSSEVENMVLDLREKDACLRAAEGMDEIYNLAADIGGVSFIERERVLCL